MPKRPQPAHVTEDELLDLAQAWGELLGEMRAASGLSQTVVAEAMGICRPNYARSELGGHTPRFETLVRAADVFGRDPVELFGQMLERARRIAAGDVGDVGQAAGQVGEEARALEADHG